VLHQWRHGLSEISLRIQFRAILSRQQ